MPFTPARMPILLSVLLILPLQALPQKVENTGVFTDSQGKAQTWAITPAHALIWNQQPYMPVGGIFEPRYLADRPTEDNWKLDLQGLETLKSKGALDIIVNPVRSALETKPEAWQRLVDYLDANGFRYGISFGSGIDLPLKGYVVKPAINRIEDVDEGKVVQWNAPEADSVRYFYVDIQDQNHVMREGVIPVKNGSITIPAESMTGKAVVLLFPHKPAVASRDGDLPDVWSGFDSYRDRLLALFGQVKFGAGLRFFLDPLGVRFGVSADAESMISDSPGFSLEWEAYLKRRYPTIDDLMNAWALNDRDVKDFRQAAKLFPLWNEGRGISFLVNSESGNRLEARGGDSRFWFDLHDFRSESISYYLNTAADLLKREVADVPVVYTRTQYFGFFTNDNKKGGFDGLGISAYAKGSALVTGGADSVYSQCEEAAHPMWCLVTETADSSSQPNNDGGYTTRDSLFRDLDLLRGIGAKGFFVNGYQAVAATGSPQGQLISTPEKLSWLTEYGTNLNKQAEMANVRLQTLPFPTCASGFVHPGTIPGTSVQWTPSGYSGFTRDFGFTYAGYTIQLPEGDVTVMWSRHGQRLTHLLLDDPRNVAITTPDGQPVKTKIDIKKRTVEVVMEETPLLIRCGKQDAFPIEAADDTLKQLKEQLSHGQFARLQIEGYQHNYELAQTNMKLNDPKRAFSLAIDCLNSVIGFVLPYTWIEAESASSQTFSEVVNDNAASGGRFLALNTVARPGRAGYGAVFPFSVPTDDQYYVWAACTPPGPDASPFAWIIDTGQPHASTDGAAMGRTFLNNRFVWVNLGRLIIAKGQHTLTLRVTDPAPSGQYNLLLDSILITRYPFTPDGILKPQIVNESDKNGPPPARIQSKKGKK